MTPIVDKQLINLKLEANSQLEAVEVLTDMLYKSGRITSKEIFIQGILDREKEVTTGFGHGLAIPHCKSEVVKTVSVVIAKNQNPLDWNSLDDQPVNFIILLAIPEKKANTTHLRVLSAISSKLVDDDFRELLMECDDPRKILDMLSNINALQ